MTGHSRSILLSLKLNTLMALVMTAMLTAACAGPGQPATAVPAPSLPAVTGTSAASQTPTATRLPSATFTPVPSATQTLVPTATPKPLVPNFSHIVVIVMENLEFSSTIGNYRDMPNFNAYAKQYTLLTQFYALSRNGSLLNYIAMIGGQMFDVKDNYYQGVIKAPSLPDQIEQSGRTWKAYEESMPKACYLQDTIEYVIHHNPFAYFDAIRNNPARCQNDMVPLTDLDADLQNGTLPNYAFIMPNLCHSAHDWTVDPKCPIKVADDWLGNTVNKLLDSEILKENSLIVLTWDEGQGSHGCCGMDVAGGRVATILISPLAKASFQDATPYTHYSLLKTIETAWGMPWLGNAADPQMVVIEAPWK
jgi:phospholipase C